MWQAFTAFIAYWTIVTIGGGWVLSRYMKNNKDVTYGDGPTIS